VVLRTTGFFQGGACQTGVPLQGLSGENSNGSDLRFPSQIPGRLAAVAPEAGRHSRFERHPGRQILESCRDCFLRMPEDVAVLGVDNDELLCSLSSPLLSSVEQGAKRLGYETAKLLDSLIGKPASLKVRKNAIDPFGVVARASTDVLAIEDPHLAKAMRFISQHFADGICVEDVVAAGGLSRSGMEKKLHAKLRFSIGSTIPSFSWSGPANSLSPRISH